MKNASALALITVFLITLLLIVFVPALNAASEAPPAQWEKTYGPRRGQSVASTTDGGYAIAGQRAVWHPYEPHN